MEVARRLQQLHLSMFFFNPTFCVKNLQNQGFYRRIVSIHFLSPPNVFPGSMRHKWIPQTTYNSEKSRIYLSSNVPRAAPNWTLRSPNSHTGTPPGAKSIEKSSKTEIPLILSLVKFSYGLQTLSATSQCVPRKYETQLDTTNNL